MKMPMFFKRLLTDSSRRLDWIQIEVTSHCNARCRYCPHTAYRNHWQPRHLSPEAFSRLTTAFHQTGLIYLQGWGEPFLHSGLWEMVHAAKASGCKVGTTTNATRLDEATVERMLAEGLDVIGFSLAGIDERNDRVREGTSFRATLKWIERIRAAREKRHLQLPRIHIAYMLLRSGLKDLEKLPGVLGGSGADQIVVNSLSLVVSPELDAETLPAPEDHRGLQVAQRMKAAREAAVKSGTDLHFHMPSPEPVAFQCSENIEKALVVGSDGRIGPCVFTRMPATGENFHYSHGRRVARRDLTFGDIHTDSLDAIRRRARYRRFLQQHAAGRPPAACEFCLKGQPMTKPAAM
jgi:MoaA/NifB/PqqE/SkfB family radical SAM enzyme